MNTHAITSVTHPAFRRHGVKNSPMIHVPLTGVGSVIFVGADGRGLLKRTPERTASGIVTQ